MPYIDEKTRTKLENDITNIVDTIKNISDTNHINFNNTEITDHQILNILGIINYTFTKIIMKSIGSISYNKIAMITGVLENIKQEFYRRAASTYEDSKIRSNGDIKEYNQLR